MRRALRIVWQPGIDLAALQDVPHRRRAAAVRDIRHSVTFHKIGSCAP